MLKVFGFIFSFFTERNILFAILWNLECLISFFVNSGVLFGTTKLLKIQNVTFKIQSYIEESMKKLNSSISDDISITIENQRVEKEE